MPEICLALGSNLGDREKNLTAAIARLGEKITLTQIATPLETAPVGGPPGQGNYLNSAVRGVTSLSPPALLSFCLGVEKALGRIRPAPCGSARPLDIDVIFYGAEISTAPDLQIPHPRYAERYFVLAPLNEIAAAWRDPRTGDTVAQLFAKLTGQK
jgi:2-amino-4-hydroxy-6-hydroxymethyldihydropteridine diphosphokinase